MDQKINSLTATFNHNKRLTQEQVENMNGLGINCSTDHTEKQVLKLLRKQPIKEEKRFKVTDFSTPRFNIVIKPLH